MTNFNYVGEIYGFRPFKAESNNKVAPSSYDEKIFVPFDNLTYTTWGQHVTLADGTAINNGDVGRGNRSTVYGYQYPGTPGGRVRNSANAIFFKPGSKIREKDNDTSTTNFTNSSYMYPTGIGMYGEAKKGPAAFASGFTCQGTHGYPFQVYGLSFDYFVTKAMGMISAAGTNHNFSSGAAQKFYTRQQINNIWGIWYQYKTGSYICKKFLPNGDNWGGRANVNIAGGKYIFRNTQSWTTGAGDEIMRPEKNYNGQEENQDNDVLGKKFRIRAMINASDTPPANSIFVGFHWQQAFGQCSDPKKRMFNISNMQIIDPMSAKLFYGKPEYHGFNPKESPYNIVRPVLLDRRDQLDASNPTVELESTFYIDTD